METTKTEWAEFHLAAADVCQRNARKADGQDGQDLYRQADADEEPQRVVGIDSPELLAISARGLRRSARRLQAACAACAEVTARSVLGIGSSAKSGLKMTSPREASW